MDFSGNLNTSLSHLESRYTLADIKTGISIQYKQICRYYYSSAQVQSWMSKSSSSMIFPKVITSQRNTNWTNALKQSMIWILNSVKIMFHWHIYPYSWYFVKALINCQTKCWLRPTSTFRLYPFTDVSTEAQEEFNVSIFYLSIYFLWIQKS